MYSIHCTLYTVERTVYSVQCREPQGKQKEFLRRETKGWIKTRTRNLLSGTESNTFQLENVVDIPAVSVFKNLGEGLCTGLVLGDGIQ